MLFLQARIFRAGQEMLSTKELMTVPIRPLVDRTYLEQVLLSRFSHGEVQQWVQK